MSEDEEFELRREIEGLKIAVAYLSSCHAATYEGAASRKSTSKYELTRLQSIATSAAAFCRGDYSPARVKFHYRNAQEALKHAEERCLQAANDKPKSN